MGIQDAKDPEHQQLASFSMRIGRFGTAVGDTLCRSCVLGIMGRDTLPMIRDRTPQIAQLVVTSLSSAVPPAAGCLAELHKAATVARPARFLVASK